MPDRAWLEQPPPWVVFPGMAPLEAAADQGAQEAWVDQVWRPFWASLGAAERDAYLSHWGASEAWRGAIHFLFETPEGFDAAADAAESARWLAGQAEPAARSPGGITALLSRLFGKRG